MNWASFYLCPNGFCNDMVFSPLVAAWSENGINCLTSLTMDGFIPPLYCFEQECQFEEVFLIGCPLLETTVVELDYSY
ncbi:unnamed protein product [Eruca vesicaria subsp. sativa]|uniref:Uncharacterized protein n=1 Tax=Eruca vesicaria subsp. sativa TaxID=29727 RepID=A0ABC8KPP3_ERUVS|nr:unnamed protein product [Eruca vesicaria subsp. sativa]